jgi:hypothetical protein
MQDYSILLEFDYKTGNPRTHSEVFSKLKNEQATGGIVITIHSNRIVWRTSRTNVDTS